MAALNAALEKYRNRQAALAQESAAVEAATAKKGAKGEMKKGGRGRGPGRGAKNALASQDAPAAATPPTGGSMKVHLQTTTTVAPSKLKADKKKLEEQHAALGEATIGKLLKDVLDLLKEKRPHPVTLEDIWAAKGIRVQELPELQQQMRQHNNMELTPSGGYVFRALHQLNGKDDLLREIQRRPAGLQADELPESYDGVLTDLQALKESHDVWLIRSGGSDIAYPRDKSAEIPMDEEVCRLWHETKLPGDANEFEAAMRAAKIEPTQRAMPRKREQKAPKEKRKRPRYAKKITNAHLPELFKGDAPVQIDVK